MFISEIKLNLSSSIGGIVLSVLGVAIALFIIAAVIYAIVHKNNKIRNSYRPGHDPGAQTPMHDSIDDYKEHKDEAYFQIRAHGVMSEGEKILYPHLKNLIDPSKYKIVTNPNYSRYLEPNPNRPVMYQKISADKIKGLVADFGIEKLDGTPICFIEYDDSTHQCDERKERDKFLASACYHAQFPRIIITSKEFNSAIEKDHYLLHKFYKDTYKKFYFAINNPLNLPPLKCKRCGQELLVFADKYGLFLSHGVKSECTNKINIFDLRTAPASKRNDVEYKVLYVDQKTYDDILDDKYETIDKSYGEPIDEYEIKPLHDN